MKVGDCCDIVEILSTAERDFLLRNNGDKVKIESLRGKTICIYFLYSLRAGRDLYINLADVYNELSPKGEFEVVVVAARGVGSPKNKKRKIDLAEKRKLNIKYKEFYENIFSSMPWLCIPYCAVKTRKHLCYLFSMRPSRGSECIILDPNGKVVSDSGRNIFREYGAEGYPFTAERIKEIEKEDELLRGNLCLKTLLGSSTSDFVITNENVKVPISELKGKVVGLYMYDCAAPLTKRNLVTAYKKLKQMEKNFEIVMVNLHFNSGCHDTNSFWKDFKKMPWLALPFMDKRCRKLWRIFEHPCVGYIDGGTLLIFGPDGNFVETYGCTILEKYGIEAYPFTKEKVVEIETKRRKEATLDGLFAKATKDYLIKRDGTKVPFSDIKGKNILLFAPPWNCKERCDLLPKLREWYNEIKERDATFEIIYVPSTDDSRHSYNNFFLEMPWLAFPWETNMQYQLFDLIGGYTSELVAFGSDGRFVTINALSHLQDHGVDAYPFAEDDIAEEIWEELESMPYN